MSGSILSPPTPVDASRRRIREALRAASFDEPMELVPANAYTVVGHMASALALAVGLV